MRDMLTEAVMRDTLTRVGLIDGVDFRMSSYADVQGTRQIGTVVSFYGAEAPRLVAARADEIESMMQVAGLLAHVTVRYPFQDRRHQPVVELSDFGTKVREQPPSERKVHRTRTSVTSHVARSFPRGTRVLAVDQHGVTARATVNGLNLVATAETDPEDPDLAPEWRARLGVTWDRDAHNAGSDRRGLVYADQIMLLAAAFRSPQATSCMVGARFTRDGVSFTGGFPQPCPVTATVVLADFGRNRVTFDLGDPQASSLAPKRFSLSLDDFRAAWVISHDTV